MVKFSFLVICAILIIPLFQLNLVGVLVAETIPSSVNTAHIDKLDKTETKLLEKTRKSSDLNQWKLFLEQHPDLVFDLTGKDLKKSIEKSTGQNLMEFYHQQRQPDQVVRIYRSYLAEPKFIKAKNLINITLSSIAEFEWTQTVKLDSEAEYLAFQQKWPGYKIQVAKQITMLKDNQEFALWEPYAGTGDPNKLKEYMDLHPSGKFVKAAQDSIKAIANRKQKLLYAEVVTKENQIIADIKTNGVGKRFVIPIDFLPTGGSYEVFPAEGNDEVFMMNFMYPGDSVRYGMVGLMGGGSMDSSTAYDYDVHRYRGEMVFPGKNDTQYTIIGEGDNLNFLTFLYLNQAYVYLRGIGRVIGPNQKEVKLGY